MSLGTTNLGLEETFTKYIHQKDIAILLVTLQIANKIRPLVEAFESNNNPFPAILEIPSKELPYDPEKDSMMKRVQKLFTAD